MRKVVLFAVALVASVAALLATVFWYIVIYRTGDTSISGMMGQMMGNNPSSSSMGIVSMPSYVWSLIVALLAASAVAVAGVAYFLIFPEIRNPPSQIMHANNPPEHQADETVSPMQGKVETTTRAITWPILVRTSKPDERKVLEVLSSHGGKYLQKFIVKESGLSKLKTHRIVSRLAERGIITITKSGNTNEIALADWLNNGSSKT